MRAIFLVATAAFVAGCASSPFLPPPPPPPPPPPSTGTLAYLSATGDEAGTKVTAVDGVLIEGYRGPHPVDAPVGLDPAAGVWLAPGFHVVQVQLVRNVEGGMSLSRGDVRVTVFGGHTYMAHPEVRSDFGQVSFTIADYGAFFPCACLPASIHTQQQFYNTGNRRGLTRADVLECAGRMR